MLFGCSAYLCKAGAASGSTIDKRPGGGLACCKQDVRQTLYDELLKLNPDKDWSFITRQIGMFSFTGRL